MRGKKHKQSTIDKMSKTRKRLHEEGKSYTQKTRDKISQAFEGKTYLEILGSQEKVNSRKEKLRLQLSLQNNNFKTHDTTCEIKIENILKDLEFDYIKQVWWLNGFPDFMLNDYKVLIFADGDYWHCNPNRYKKDYFHKGKQKYAKDLWERDKKVTKSLEKKGYTVLRFWETDICNNIKTIINELKNIKEIYGKQKNNLLLSKM